MESEQIINVISEAIEQNIDVVGERHETDISVQTDAINMVVNRDYNAMSNKPSINGVELQGNKTTSELGIDIPVVPTNVSAFANDAGYLTEHQDLSDYATEDYVDEAVSHVSIDAYTKAQTDALLDEKADANDVYTKTQTDTLLSGKSNANHTHDDRYYTESETNALLAEKADSDDLSAVALSGNYNDLSNKPTIPTVPTNVSAFTNDAGYLIAETDPTIPSWAKQSSKPSYSKSEVGLGNVDNVRQYSATNPPPYPVTSVNGSTGDVTVNVPTVPTKLSEFTDDLGSSPTHTHSQYLTQHQDISGKADAFTVGEGLDMTSQVLSNEQSIEYIVGTQTAATNVWKGVTKDSSLRIGKVIAYYLPFAGTSTAATLNLTLADGSTTGAIPLRRTASSTVTTQFAADNVIIMIYDGDYWKVAAYYDTNTNTIAYQVRTNSGTLPMTDIVYRYRLLFTSADNTHWVPANKSSSTNATAKRDTCQTPINPFGPIVYYGTTASVAAGSSPSAANLWQQYGFALGYSFNRTGAALVLDFPKPIYLKCEPQSDGSAIIDAESPYVQALPTTADGKIYIYLGIAYSATNIELRTEHPVYYHDGTRIRLYTDAVQIPSANGVSF